MSLKITFVTETFPPEVNGVAMTVGRLVSGMRERGHRVSVIRPRQGKADTGNEHEMAMPGLPLPGYRLALRLSRQCGAGAKLAAAAARSGACGDRRAARLVGR